MLSFGGSIVIPLNHPLIIIDGFSIVNHPFGDPPCQETPRMVMSGKISGVFCPISSQDARDVQQQYDFLFEGHALSTSSAKAPRGRTTLRGKRYRDDVPFWREYGGIVLKSLNAGWWTISYHSDHGLIIYKVHRVSRCCFRRSIVVLLDCRTSWTSWLGNPLSDWCFWRLK